VPALLDRGASGMSYFNHALLPKRLRSFKSTFCYGVLLLSLYASGRDWTIEAMEMPTLHVASILGLPWLRQTVRENGYRDSMKPFGLLTHKEIKATNCSYFKWRVLSRDRARLGKLSSGFFEF
jgi:hypothetical protein